VEGDPGRRRRTRTKQVAVHFPYDDRCCGREAWAEQLEWAETTFGQALKPHDPRAGLSPAIRTAYEEGTGALSAGASALLDLLSHSQGGWEPSELSTHVDLVDLPGLILQAWVVSDGQRIRLHALWWPVRGDAIGARSQAAQLWRGRLLLGREVDLSEVQAAFTWPEVEAELASELVLLALPRAERGSVRVFTRACTLLLERPLSPRTQCRLLLTRSGTTRMLRLFGNAYDDAEQAFLIASRDVPNLVGPAHAGLADSAFARGDMEDAIEHYTHAIPLMEEAGLPRALGLRTNFGALLFDHGRHEEGLQHVHAALATAVRQDLTQTRRHAESTLATLLLELSWHDEAIVLLSELYESEKQEPHRAARHATFLGIAALDLGRMDEAGRWLDLALAHAAADTYRLALVHVARGCLAAFHGDWEAANDDQTRAITLYADAQSPTRALFAHCAAAVGHHRLGQMNVAGRRLRAATALLEGRDHARGAAVLALARRAMGLHHDDVPPEAALSVFCRLFAKVWGLGLGAPAVQEAALCGA
jgi:tetratricopeptide (TPR) repeat protein